MTTYWVRYTFNVAIEPSGVTSPQSSSLSFLGNTLVPGSVVVTADPTPFTTFDQEFYLNIVDLGFSAPTADQIYRMIMHSSISDFYVVGSMPAPAELRGGLTTSDALPDVPGGTPMVGVTYYSFAWEQITITNASATLAIFDADVSEGDPSATFRVALSEGLAYPVTVNYATQNGSALAGLDYDVTSGTLTFAAGETSKLIAVPIISDAVAEGDETFSVILSGAAAVGGVTPSIQNSSGVGTISDTLPLEVTISDASVLEGSGSGLTELHFSVSLNHAFQEGTLTVAVPTNSIGISNDQLSYSSANIYDVPALQNSSLLQFTFHPGETTGTVTVLVAPDNLPEPDELFSVKLAVTGNTTGLAVTVSDNIGVGTVHNDDGILALADVTFDAAFNAATQSLISADIEAAILRLENALGGRVPHLEINVIADSPGGDVQAQAAPAFSLFHKGKHFVEIPNALAEVLTGQDPNGSGADITLHLPSDIGTRWYGQEEAGRSTVDSTSILTHELLHGLGFGADHLLFDTPWDLLVKNDVFKGKMAGKVAVTDDGHLAALNDLMSAFPPQIPTEISTTDIAIMNDLGFGANKPAWWDAHYTLLA
ncbi:Calx-beta domain-containing protein [Bradyrhizobium sp. 18]|uniref:Calx-beta domain-containing protein n=1 Tax=Bradyrhizobium sp. 18 TaxID=2782657 RepID=UPI001FF91D82|nr:Calx-beta domain-containing protein [Bradyrhizobium sp. 18]MCK1506320.1 hypothetical protein [Bradyrhizobium sp. 18]